MNAIPQTYLRRKTYGDKSWTAKSYEDFELNGRTARLEIGTWKNDSGKLVTMASVGFVKGDIVTTAIFIDFSARLEVSQARCTEKAISEQQTRAVARWNEIKQNVLDFYSAKQAA